MKYTYLCMLLCFCLFSNAQITVTGTVTTITNNEILAFVNISTNHGKGTITDENGNYTIVVNSKEDRLTFSFLGFKSQTIIVGDKTIINVALLEDESSKIVYDLKVKTLKTKESDTIVEEVLDRRFREL